MNVRNEKIKMGVRFLILICLAVCTAGRQPVRAAGMWYVTPKGNDAGTCSIPLDPCGTLAMAIGRASAGDTVYVSAGTYTSIMTGAVVKVNKNLTLSGGWDTDFTTQAGTSVIDGQGVRQGIHVEGATVRIENFTVQNGTSDSFGGGIFIDHASAIIMRSIIKDNSSKSMGGGIHVFGDLTLNDLTIKNNATGDPCCTGGEGGGIGIYNGTVTVNNSVISGNTSASWGSGIYGITTIILNNSTVSENKGPAGAVAVLVGQAVLNNSTVTNNQGYGLFNVAGNMQYRNTIVADNSGLDCFIDPGYSSTMTSLGYNLIETQQGCTLASSDLTNLDPMLAGLTDNGGSTYTQALLTGSPAINAGDPAGCEGSAGLLTIDQRGYPRADRCDIGAYEWQTLDSYMTVGAPFAAAGSQVGFTIYLVNRGGTDMAGLAVSDIMPETLAYVEGSLDATGGVAGYAAGGITWTGTVPASGSVAITFDATIDHSARGTTITNEASATLGSVVYNLTARVQVPAPYPVFLPLVMLPRPGIMGHVTVNGVPAAGVSLNLCERISGGSCGTPHYVTTDENGYYEFTSLESAGPGVTYSVVYTNSSGPGIGPAGQLAHAREIANYTSNQQIYFDSFDIADAPLISPAPYTVVSLPATFQWTKRPATSIDNYQVEFIDPTNQTHILMPLQGYTDSYTIEALSGGLVTGKNYYWTVRVNSLDGGYGNQYGHGSIIFQ